MVKTYHHNGAIIQYCGRTACVASWGKWVVLLRYSDRGPIADAHCPHFHTISEARVAIDQMVANAQRNGVTSADIFFAG